MPAKFDIIMLDAGPKLQLSGCQCDKILSADDLMLQCSKWSPAGDSPLVLSIFFLN